MIDEATRRLEARLEVRGLLEGVWKIARTRRVTLKQLAGRGRTRAVSAARHVIWQWMRSEFNFSYPEIGIIWDRDHTTVMAALTREGSEAKQIEDAAAQEIAAWVRAVRDRFPALEARDLAIVIANGIEKGDWRIPRKVLRGPKVT
jgi:hypothetical protein